MSDNYIVSARKYRPQTFDTVVGQEHITTTLKNAIKNQHLAHAFLFCGPRGVGKTTCARILAKTINCETPTADMEACGICPTCVAFQNNASFNVFELDAASNNSVDDIRELINQVRFAPQQGRYKVYIIDEVHMLTASAFNAFLKLLEEPPPYAIFILATTEKHKVLPTIQSRCQIFEFRRITTHDIVAHLQGIAAKEGMVAQEASLHVIAQKSEGCMRDALSMLDRIASFTNGMLTYSNTMEHLNLLDADFYFRLTDSMLSQDVAGTLLQLDQALEKGFEGDVIINGLAEHFRNLLLCKDQRMVMLLDVPGDLKSAYFEKANQSPPSFILSALNVITDCELQYKNATNKRLHVELCMIRLCFLMQAVSGAEVSIGSPDAEGVKKNSSSVENAVETVVAPEKKTLINNEQVADYEHVDPVISVVEEPEPQPVVKEKEVVASAPIVEEKPRPAVALAGNGRRLSKGLSSIDDDIIKAASNKEKVEKVLTLEMAEGLFETYKKQLQAADKAAIYAQFSMMRMEVLPPDQINIICPSQLTEMYAKEQRNVLIDFCSSETQMVVRITTEIQEDEAVKAAQNNVVLSKSEIFDVMASKNPSLGKLKDVLGMQIEY